MAILKGLLGNSSKDREVAEDMRAILAEFQGERERNQAVIERANAAVERIQEIGQPIVKISTDMDELINRLAGLEKRFEAMTELSAQLLALDERAEYLSKGQEKAETQVASAIQEGERIRTIFEDLSGKVDVAVSLKDRLESFLEVEKPFQLLRGDAESIRGQVDSTGEQMARLREQHDRLLDSHKTAVSKMEALDRRREEHSRDMQDKERRVASVEQSIRAMDGVQHTVDDVRREMQTLKALGDVVSQKSAALEAQRDAVEGAISKADQLDRAMRQIDSGIRQQHENESILSAMQDQVMALRSLHETVLEQSGEISQLQRTTDERTRATRQDLGAMQEEMKKTIERFDFESRGLESVSQRVSDLRGSLNDFENRYKTLGDSIQLAGYHKAQTTAVSTHVQSLSENVVRMDEDLRGMQSLRRDLDDMNRTARDAGAQMTRIQDTWPAIEAALRDLEQLNSAHAMVKDALERTQITHTEITRMQEGQSETRTWLSGIEQSVGDLRDRMNELRAMTPQIEAAQKQAQRIGETVASIDSRREFVDNLQRRITEVGALVARLDERDRQLQTRMDAAEHQLSGLEGQAAQADRLHTSISEMASEVHQAEHDVTETRKAVAAIESRCESVEALAERTQALRKELEQRQHALTEATKDLQRVSASRQEAAAAAQQLEEISKQLTSAIAGAEQRVAAVEDRSAGLDDRASILTSVEKRLDLFGERLGKWELVDQEVARSLEQIASRQGTVQSLQADLDRMFSVAEKTSADVRTITSAHREIQESRGLLREVMEQVRSIRDLESSLDDRKRQMTKAEERLARAEALLVDVNSSLEALQGQRVIVEQAVEKAGSLQFLLKQAEAMIDGLREERNMTNRVKAAKSKSREDDEEEVANAA
jgi:chromosome segregation ATPase